MRLMVIATVLLATCMPVHAQTLNDGNFTCSIKAVQRCLEVQEGLQDARRGGQSAAQYCAWQATEECAGGNDAADANADDDAD